MMDGQYVRDTLEQVKLGKLSVDDAAARLRFAPIADLGFAKVDRHRNLRCGFPEVIFCQGKTAEQVAAIFSRIVEQGAGCLATRATSEQAAAVRDQFPECQYDPIGRTLWHGTIDEGNGLVAILTAGTSDLPVAKEAQTTAHVMGCKTRLIVDVGVAGLHRLLGQFDQFATADCVVVCAGMEAALPSVVGGLVDCPVLAVPTSVGYGASFNGLAALLGMVNSCAANVAAVNIDAGFCGGYIAALIARRAHHPAPSATAP